MCLTSKEWVKLVKSEVISNVSILKVISVEDFIYFRKCMLCQSKPNSVVVSIKNCVEYVHELVSYDKEIVLISQLDIKRCYSCLASHWVIFFSLHLIEMMGWESIIISSNDEGQGPQVFIICTVVVVLELRWDLAPCPMREGDCWRSRVRCYSARFASTQVSWYSVYL